MLPVCPPAAVTFEYTMTDDPITIIFASETGFVEEIAEETEDDLEIAGHEVQLLELAEVTPALLADTSPILFMTSTTGDGDPPLTARAFRNDVMATSPDLSQLSYGLLVAGDSSYPTFCGFGRHLEQWLQSGGAQALFSAVYVDSEDEADIEQWRERLLQALARDGARATGS